THTLHYGLGAFEGIRAYEQADGRAGIWHLDAHLERLVDSVRMIRMHTEFTHEQLSEACCEVLRVNKFTEAYLRPLVIFGDGAMGLGARYNPVQTIIAAWKWGAYLGEEGLEKGVRIK